jgi:iron complex transport system substrate-binding protein
MKKSIPFIILAVLIILATVLLIINSQHNTAGKNTIQSKIPLDIKPSSPKAPSRIVSLAPNITEILYDLALEDKIIGVSSDSNFPLRAQEKAKVGTFWQPNTETIISLEPNLVITLSFQQQKQVADTLTRLGYNILTVKIETIDDLYNAIEQIGEAVGRRQTADKSVSRIKNRIKLIEVKLQNFPRPRVIWSVQDEPLRVAGVQSFLNNLIELAGGTNVIGSTLAQYPQISSEQVITGRPDVILQSAMGPQELDAQLENARSFWGRWPDLPAVANDRIYIIDPDLTLRLSPRLPEAIINIANCLHPQINLQNTNKTITE